MVELTVVFLVQGDLDETDAAEVVAQVVEDTGLDVLEWDVNQSAQQEG